MPELRNLDVEWVSLVDRAAVRNPDNPTEPQRFLLWKREQGSPTTTGGTEMTPEETRAAITKAETERDEANTALAKAEQERDALTARVTELEKAVKPDPVKPEPINKDELPPAVREALEKAETERADMAKRVEEAEKIAKSERDERITREFITKAEALSALPIEAGKFGPVLKSASEHLTTDEFTALEGVLKAADEQIRKGDLFRELGRGGQPAGGTALQEATVKAEEIRKADPKISKTTALDMALNADRALQERYLAEVR